MADTLYTAPFNNPSQSGTGPSGGVSGTTPQTLLVTAPAADIVTPPTGGQNNFATTYTFPAGSIKQGSAYRIAMGFKYVSGNATATVAFKSTLGGTDFCSFQQGAQGTSLTRMGSLIIDVVGANAVGTTANVVGVAAIPPGSQAASLTPFDGQTTVQPVPLNTTGSLVFQPQFSSNIANANITLQLLSMIVTQLA